MCKLENSFNCTCAPPVHARNLQSRRATLHRVKGGPLQSALIVLLLVSLSSRLDDTLKGAHFSRANIMCPLTSFKMRLDVKCFCLERADILWPVEKSSQFKEHDLIKRYNEYYVLYLTFMIFSVFLSSNMYVFRLIYGFGWYVFIIITGAFCMVFRENLYTF